MNEPKKKSIAETLHLKIQTPWVWLVLVLTVCLTALFYVSQKPQVAVYSQYAKSLCDYQYAEASLMRSMERVRNGFEVDTSFVISQMMTLREVVLSFETGFGTGWFFGSVQGVGFALQDERLGEGILFATLPFGAKRLVCGT